MTIFTETTEAIRKLVNQTNQIEVIYKRNVLKDGEVIASTEETRVWCPGDDVSGESAQIRAIALAIWTPEVVANYQELVESERLDV